MKKIDFHIHTVPTICDVHFSFDMDAFKRYVIEAKLDAVAVTNHDIFDGVQFRRIKDELGTVVFPGIEINVEKGHVLIIAEAASIETFEAKTKLVSQKIRKIGDSISVDELIGIFGDLSKYLVIPHYDKHPSISGSTLERLSPFIAAGEVDSAKKFVRTYRDPAKITPVLFSDVRIRADLDRIPTRQTYIDCGELSISAIRSTLRDKTKVALSENDGNAMWQVFEDGQSISTGLNILLGERSSGKTHTLERIVEAVEKVKYIKQFSLVQRDEETYERDFNNDVERRRSVLSDEYLAGFKKVIESVMHIDLEVNDVAADKYLTTLLKAAQEADRRDHFSKASLFNEELFSISKTKTLQDLIRSVRQVIENVEYRAIIAKHLKSASLLSLACELIELLWEKDEENRRKSLVNELMKDVKQRLKIRSSATSIEDIDLYSIAMDRKRIDRFVEMAISLRVEGTIFEESIQGFRIVATKGAYRGAAEVRVANGSKGAFGETFKLYKDPYKFLRLLVRGNDVAPAELYRLFAKISYKILNKDGVAVSGGERSEFRLLQEIADAQNFEILLIDEPESSFDNLFLKSDVNKILKDISRTMPVVVVTHNNTVGASVKPDFLLYARKEIENGKPVYRLYSGYPADKRLKSIDGREVNSHVSVMDSLEAGSDSYDDRRVGYEAIKN